MSKVGRCYGDIQINVYKKQSNESWAKHSNLTAAGSEWIQSASALATTGNWMFVTEEKGCCDGSEWTVSSFELVNDVWTARDDVPKPSGLTCIQTRFRFSRESIFLEE